MLKRLIRLYKIIRRIPKHNFGGVVRYNWMNTLKRVVWNDRDVETRKYNKHGRNFYKEKMDTF